MGTPDLTRRAFLTARTQPPAGAIRPPGLVAASGETCADCDICAEACPTGIIRKDAGLPLLDFRAGDCSFCGACAAQCPKDLFEAERRQRFDHVAAIGDRCLAQHRVDCQSCRDACPVEAIRFRPRLGGPFLPVLDTETCTGCGACIAVCPADAVAVTPRQKAFADA